MKFRATVELNGKTATGIQVPPEVVESLQSGKRPAVQVTINNHAYRSTVASMDGKFMLPLSAENRKLAGVAAGDEVDIEVTLDTEPRELVIPPDFKGALDDDEDARHFFEGLSRSARLRIVLSIEGAKTTETRLRRITRAINDLHEEHV